MNQIEMTPADFVASLNQTFEYAYPSVVIIGELSNFRVSKGKWVYLDLKDEFASLSMFGTIYHLPGPLEDGLMLKISATPKLHPRYGFTLNIQSIQVAGEGSLKRAAQMLEAKLKAEGLFAVERKRQLPRLPSRVGLITAAGSAAAADFIKIINERWAGLEVMMVDVLVQGLQSPAQITKAIEILNQEADVPDVLVITRGGGSAEDLAAFNDEHVVRAVAGSRIPTLVAIGHEVDISLAELAADQRASTPTNAATILTPDKQHELETLTSYQTGLLGSLVESYRNLGERLAVERGRISEKIRTDIAREFENLKRQSQVLGVLDPRAALKRGYALVSGSGGFVRSVKGLKVKDEIKVQLHDGTIGAIVTEI